MVLKFCYLCFALVNRKYVLAFAKIILLLVVTIAAVIKHDPENTLNRLYGESYEAWLSISLSLNHWKNKEIDTDEVKTPWFPF